MTLAVFLGYCKAHCTTFFARVKTFPSIVRVKSEVLSNLNVVREDIFISSLTCKGFGQVSHSTHL